MEAFPADDGEEYVPTLEDDPALGLSHRAKMEILFAVMLGLFLGALDQTIVGPALPTIVTQLSGNDYYVWAITIYLLTSTISVPFWGKLSDIYGRKPIFMIGIVDLPGRLGPVRPEPEHGACSSCSEASRASAPVRCSRSRSRSSATCSPRRSAASTRACSGPCSVSRSSPARSSAAG